MKDRYIRKNLIILGCIFLGLAILSKFYTLIGKVIIRSFVGDFLAVLILIILLKVVFIKLKNTWVSLIVVTFAMSIELFQLANNHYKIINVNNFILEILFGKSFDVIDLLVYILAGIIGYFILQKLEERI